MCCSIENKKRKISIFSTKKLHKHLSLGYYYYCLFSKSDNIYTGRHITYNHFFYFFLYIFWTQQQSFYYFIEKYIHKFLFCFVFYTTLTKVFIQCWHSGLKIGVMLSQTTSIQVDTSHIITFLFLFLFFEHNNKVFTIS